MPYNNIPSDDAAIFSLNSDRRAHLARGYVLSAIPIQKAVHVEGNRKLKTKPLHSLTPGAKKIP